MKPVLPPLVLRQPRGIALVVALIVAGTSAAAIAALYLAGGTGNLNPGVLLVPILLGSFYYGPLVGIGLAIALGLVVGPLMPLAPDVSQETLDWALRIVFYGLGAGMVGALSAMIYRKNELLERRRRELEGLNRLFQQFLASRVYSVLQECTGQLALLVARLEQGKEESPPRGEMADLVARLQSLLKEGAQLLEHARTVTGPSRQP